MKINNIEAISNLVIFLRSFKLEINDDACRVIITNLATLIVNTQVICDSINNNEDIIDQKKLILDIPFSGNYLRFTVEPKQTASYVYDVLSEPNIRIEVIEKDK